MVYVLDVIAVGLSCITVLSLVLWVILRVWKPRWRTTLISTYPVFLPEDKGKRMLIDGEAFEILQIDSSTSVTVRRVKQAKEND